MVLELRKIFRTGVVLFRKGELTSSDTSILPFYSDWVLI